MCAALLHDLGHGPFSHSFEKVFDLDHEQFTQQIIVGDTEVNKILLRVGRDFPKKVAEVIAKTYKGKLVVSLISSQIDADRMDYLQRDAYFTGVSYGHFDMERLLRVMRPREEHAVIKQSGMHAVEDYIMSRYQMYWQVYFHPVTRSAEVILTKILHRAKHLYESGYEFAQEPHHFYSLFKGEVTLTDYLKMDESVMLYYFEAWEEENDAILKDLCTRFVNRKLFKYVEFHPSNSQMNRLMELRRYSRRQASIRIIILSSIPHQICRMIFTGQVRKRRDFRFTCLKIMAKFVNYHVNPKLSMQFQGKEERIINCIIQRIYCVMNLRRKILKNRSASFWSYRIKVVHFW